MLIITVILLLILAGVAIHFAIGDNGIFKIANEAKKDYIEGQNKEEKDLEDLYSSMLVATGEDTKITISMEDLNALIEHKVKEVVNESKMCAPILLTTASLPNTGSSTRNTGSYKASSESYTKEDTENMEKYLEYQEGKGWKVKKSGFYFFGCTKDHQATSHQQVSTISKLYINEIEYKWMIGSSSSDISNYSNCESDNLTLYLKADDIIDFEFSCSGTGKYSFAEFAIYTMFE